MPARSGLVSMLLCAALVLLGANFYRFLQHTLGDQAPDCTHEQVAVQGRTGQATFEIRGCFDADQRREMREFVMTQAAEVAANAADVEVRVRHEANELRRLERQLERTMRAHERAMRRAEAPPRPVAPAPVAPLPPEL